MESSMVGMTQEPGSTDDGAPLARPPGSRRPRRRLRLMAKAAFALAALPLLVAGGWLLANVLLRTPLPVPLYTAADLPAPPEPQDNGWVTWSSASAARGGAIAPAPILALFAPEPADPVEQRWSRLVSRLDEATAALEDKTAADRLRAFEDAIAKPRFADVCAVEPAATCPAMELMRAHDGALLRVAVRAARGDWPDALRRADALLRADWDVLVTARSLMVNAVAMANERRALEMVDLLVAGCASSPACSPGAPADEPLWAALEERVGAIATERVSLERAIVAEYLFMQAAMDLVDGGGASPAPGLLARALFDRGATLEEAQDRFGVVVGYVRAPPGTAPPVIERPRRGALWWLRNPVGKMLLDGVAFDPIPVVTRYREGRDKLAERKEQLLVRIREGRASKKGR
jgi:hypothetical protein